MITTLKDSVTSARGPAEATVLAVAIAAEIHEFERRSHDKVLAIDIENGGVREGEPNLRIRTEKGTNITLLLFANPSSGDELAQAARTYSEKLQSLWLFIPKWRRAIILLLEKAQYAMTPKWFRGVG